MRRPIVLAVLVLMLSSPFLAPLPVGRASPGDLVAIATVPVPSSIGVSVTFDGSRFYYTNYQDPTLFSYSVSCVPPSCTTTLEDSVVITLDGSPLSVGALAYDGTRDVLWGGDQVGRVVRVDPTTGFATLAFDPTLVGCGGLTLIDGMAYDAGTDSLYYSPDGATTVCQFTPAGTLLAAIQVGTIDGFTGCYNSGLALGGDILYMGTNGCGRIVAVRKDTLTSLGTFASPGGRDEGLTCDPVTFAPRSVIWSKEAYDNTATAFEIEAGTCGVGGLPPCTSPVGIALDEPEPGFDYVAGEKRAQSPVLPQPRVSGSMTLRASVTDPSQVQRVDFVVDGRVVGTDAAAPYEAAWDSTTTPFGVRVVEARLRDLAGCPRADTQPVLVVCGEPMDIAVTRPVAGRAYADDVDRPGDGGPALALGPLTVQAFVSDPTRVASVSWLLDGTTTLGTSTTAPYSVVFDTATARPGLHTLTARVQETDARCVATVSTQLRIAEVRTVGAARGVHVATAQPEEVVLGVDGRTSDDPGRTDIVDHDAGDVRARLVSDETENLASGERATSTLTDVTLLGGRVRAKALQGVAEARFDRAAFAFDASAEGTAIVDLTVDGIPVTLTAPNTALAIPGVGRLVLDERVLIQDATHVELRVAALHLYVDASGFRDEVILGHAVAGVDVAGAPFIGRATEISSQSDAGTGRDVGDAFGEAHSLGIGYGGDPYGATILGGRVGGHDQGDVYAAYARPGDKLRAVVKPSNIVHASGHTVRAPEDALSAISLDGVGAPQLRLALVDPAGATRWRSALPLSSPQRVELNVDVPGAWRLVVQSDSGLVNYTLAADVTPAPFVEPAPAATSCRDAAAPALDAPIVSSLRAADRSWWFTKHATIGDALAVTLAMPDADGQNIDLYVYDDACVLLRSSTGGSRILFDGDSPKGIPEAIAFAAPYTGTYRIEARRIVGQGNFALGADARPVIPTAPMNDALTGEDASDDANAPTPLLLPQGAFEGRFEDGDWVDAYSFPVKAGQRVAVTLIPSAPNTATFTLRDASGGDVPTRLRQDALGRATLHVVEPATADATYVLVATRGAEGGNYVFSVTSA